MNTQLGTKTDFIKFNVSPTFKVLAEQKAQEQGMTLSELGRMLFGSFVSGVAKPTLTISPEILELAKSAQAKHAAGKSRRIKSKKELDQFLDSL